MTHTAPAPVTPSGKHITWLSLASVVSALAVVALHANSAFWHYDASPESYWPSANFIETLCYFAVPVFVMMSGATLMDYRERYSTRTYAHKRIAKTVIPFLLWSVLGILFRIYYLQNLELPLSLASIIDGIINTRFITIYWFFPSLFILYLALPLFSAVPTSIRRRLFWFLVGTALVLNRAIPLTISLLHLPIDWSFTLPIVPAFVLLALLGWLIATSEPTLRQRLIAYAFGVVGFCVHLVGTAILSGQAGDISATFKGYDNIPCVLQSIAVFIALRQIGMRFGERSSQVINALAAYSFPVYLMHWFFLQIAVHGLGLDNTLLAYRLLAPIVIYALVIPLTWLVRKIPGGRFLLP